MESRVAGSQHWRPSPLVGESEMAGANRVILRKWVHSGWSVLSSRRILSTKVQSQRREVLGRTWVVESEDSIRGLLSAILTYGNCCSLLAVLALRVDHPVPYPRKAGTFKHSTQGLGVRREMKVSRPGAWKG